MRIADIIREYAEDSDAEYREFLELLVKFVIDGSGRRFDKRTSDLFRKYAGDMLVHKPVYRGIALNSWDDIDPGFDFRHRNVLQSDYFISTSFQRKTALDKFLKSWVKIKLKRFGTQAVFILLEIQTNQNTIMINPDDYRSHAYELTDNDGGNVNDEDIETFLQNLEDEEEILIAPPARFKVLKKEKKEFKWQKGTEYWFVQLEQVK